LSSYSKENKLDSLLTELDKTLKEVPVFDQEKEVRLSDLKRQLIQKDLSEEDRHQTYFQLYREYEAYIVDSAMYYVNRHLNFARETKNNYWINECNMQLARMYSTFARFLESLNLLDSINKNDLIGDQLGSYYNSYAEVYLYWSEYSDESESLKFSQMRNAYRDSALMVIPQNTYSYDINSGRKYIELHDFTRAEKALLPHLATFEPNTREYAILTSMIALLYETKGDIQMQKIYLAESAIADIYASIKENTSLRILSYYLLTDDDIVRANRYVKKSLEDANFYNARLRNIQILKILPIIDKAYQLQQEKHQRNLLGFIVAIGILLLFLVGLVFYLISQRNKLAKTRQEVIAAYDELKQINRHLSETNHIKEEYIGRFLNQCSVYIDKLEAYRKSLNKKASGGKLDELYQMLKSSQIIEDELKEFYRNFDSTFLNLFPDFVDEFNKLLPEEERIILKNENELSVELRIFALMRLGITDSAKIANFLRYSITTIYNYRSKYRNKSLVPREKFEETVMKIGYFTNNNQ
jgi:hypothetical protein